MPLGGFDSPMLFVGVCTRAYVCMSFLQRLWGVGRAVILNQWRWTHCVSSCRLLLMLLSYNSCHHLPLTRAFRPGWVLYIHNCAFAAVPVCACMHVSVRLCLCMSVCVFPSCSQSIHGTPAEHCCISAPLGFSLRLSKRLDPTVNVLEPLNRKTGRREDRGRRETRLFINEQKMKSKTNKIWAERFLGD